MPTHGATHGKTTSAAAKSKRRRAKTGKTIQPLAHGGTVKQGVTKGKGTSGKDFGKKLSTNVRGKKKSVQGLKHGGTVKNATGKAVSAAAKGGGLKGAGVGKIISGVRSQTGQKSRRKKPGLAHGGTVTGARSQSSIVSPGRSGPVSRRSGTALQRNIPGALNSNRTLGDALRGAGLPTRPQGLRHGGTVTGRKKLNKGRIKKAQRSGTLPQSGPIKGKAKGVKK